MEAAPLPIPQLSALDDLEGSADSESMLLVDFAKGLLDIGVTADSERVNVVELKFAVQKT